MADQLHVAALQVGYGDDESPADRIERVSALVRDLAAAHEGLDLIVLPELWAPTGFDYTDWPARAEPIDGPFAQAMSDLARAVGVSLHAGSFVEALPEPGLEGKQLANTSLLLAADGSLVATYRKIHRFGFGSGEPTLMEAGRGWVVVPLPLRSGGTLKLGLATCYDLRFPELFRLLLDAGAEAVAIPAAWPLARVEHWQLLGRARAIENQLVVVQVNTAGTHGGVDMGGRSQIVAGTGEVLAQLPDAQQAALVARVDLAPTRDYRASFPVLGDRRL